MTDPFAILGPHADRRGTIVRAYHPAVRAIDLRLMATGELRSMTKRDAGGLYEVRLEAFGSGDGAPDYRLRFTFPGDRAVEIDDPYRYGRVLTDFDLHLIGEGTHYRAHEKLGAHRVTIGSTTGVHFAVWAPNADRVSLVGDLNGWDGRVHPMRLLVPAGIWEIFIPDLADGEKYKFEIRTKTGALLTKADPFGFAFEMPPQSASVVRDISGYTWSDSAWMTARPAQGAWLDRPMAIYEVHLGSWARVPEEEDRYLTYRELAGRLVPYVKEMGFTHIELLPVMEHPFSPSWGYQVLGFFAPTSRFGPPADFKFFVDACHQAGLGVILDWVPGHFPKDAHGLAQFDGTALFEHVDRRQGEHQDWGTLIFNYSRHEVRNFLLSNALFWLEEYHVDGLRVDAVASMLYLDYSRREGEWIPNAFGGRENLDAIAFLQQLNSLTHGEHPGTITAAEESTAWPGVSRPVHLGGLGFTYKWNMGWMHDILQYVGEDPVHRRWHHNLVTFSMLYAFTENFVLPFSHDEVVYGKRALVDKPPGDAWQKYATLRTLYGYLYAHPGKKLLFMGGEFGQWREWHHDRSLDWHLLDDPSHASLRRYVQDLNRHYQAEPALHERDFDADGFRWIECNDNENSVVSLVRYARDRRHFIVIVCNFTPVSRADYRVGVPEAGWYAELVNSDASFYGGGDVGNLGGATTEPVAAHGFGQSLRLIVPPLGCLFLKRRQT
ncbi:MAG: 1,4-alpha-glucan branching enzyme [Acidobacteria bacterium RIFCSPLOWO2_12_FULL_65_11]|nr:MAG: 1,4-alpha-glucan branching enzyme [Acidobacteria bacterium RIFCSPLOWO2_02_FULL_64_15]OFW34066.1 MAG: 1,4-alpha-glucan branching enzyme [Acidobacteria bacterium RIFCSPLOWO2_12_FULL_65_11]